LLLHCLRSKAGKSCLAGTAIALQEGKQGQLFNEDAAQLMNEWAMETIEIGTSGIAASRMGLDTEAIGSWAWGGSTGDLERAMSTIPSAIERGMTFIHTAPVYGFGLSERIVGVMLSGGLRERAIIATQTGLEWRDGKVRRNCVP